MMIGLNVFPKLEETDNKPSVSTKDRINIYNPIQIENPYLILNALIKESKQLKKGVEEINSRTEFSKIQSILEKLKTEISIPEIVSKTFLKFF